MSSKRKRGAFGLPSGDDPAAYDGARSKSAWRWEFLRRRLDYQDDWTQFHADWQAKSGHEHFADIACMPGDAQRAKYAVEHLVNPALNWSAASGAFFCVFLGRADLLRDAARRQNLPAHLRGPERFFERMHVRRLAIDDAIDMRSDFITARIDLLQPLGPQFDHFKAVAKQAQAELKHALARRRESEWPDYLRILDLERRGLRVDAIARIIFPLVPNDHDSGYLARHRTVAALEQAKHLQDTIALGR